MKEKSLESIMNRNYGDLFSGHMQVPPESLSAAETHLRQVQQGNAVAAMSSQHQGYMMRNAHNMSQAEYNQLQLLQRQNAAETSAGSYMQPQDALHTADYQAAMSMHPSFAHQRQLTQQQQQVLQQQRQRLELQQMQLEQTKQRHEQQQSAVHSNQPPASIGMYWPGPQQHIAANNNPLNMDMGRPLSGHSQHATPPPTSEQMPSMDFSCQQQPPAQQQATHSHHGASNYHTTDSSRQTVSNALPTVPKKPRTTSKWGSTPENVNVAQVMHSNSPQQQQVNIPGNFSPAADSHQQDHLSEQRAASVQRPPPARPQIAKHAPFKTASMKSKRSDPAVDSIKNDSSNNHSPKRPLTQKKPPPGMMAYKMDAMRKHKQNDGEKYESISPPSRESAPEAGQGSSQVPVVKSKGAHMAFKMASMKKHNEEENAGAQPKPAVSGSNSLSTKPKTPHIPFKMESMRKQKEAEKAVNAKTKSDSQPSGKPLSRPPISKHAPFKMSSMRRDKKEPTPPAEEDSSSSSGSSSSDSSSSSSSDDDSDDEKDEPKPVSPAKTNVPQPAVTKPMIHPPVSRTAPYKSAGANQIPSKPAREPMGKPLSMMKMASEKLAKEKTAAKKSVKPAGKPESMLKFMEQSGRERLDSLVDKSHDQGASSLQRWLSSDSETSKSITTQAGTKRSKTIKTQQPLNKPESSVAPLKRGKGRPRKADLVARQVMSKSNSSTGYLFETQLEKVSTSRFEDVSDSDSPEKTSTTEEPPQKRKPGRPPKSKGKDPKPLSTAKSIAAKKMSSPVPDSPSVPPTPTYNPMGSPPPVSDFDLPPTPMWPGATPATSVPTTPHFSGSTVNDPIYGLFGASRFESDTQGLQGPTSASKKSPDKRDRHPRKATSVTESSKSEDMDSVVTNVLANINSNLGGNDDSFWDMGSTPQLPSAAAPLSQSISMTPMSMPSMTSSRMTPSNMAGRTPGAKGFHCMTSASFSMPSVTPGSMTPGAIAAAMSHGMMTPGGLTPGVPTSMSMYGNQTPMSSSNLPLVGQTPSHNSALLSPPHPLKPEVMKTKVTNNQDKGNTTPDSRKGRKKGGRSGRRVRQKVDPVDVLDEETFQIEAPPAWLAAFEAKSFDVSGDSFSLASRMRKPDVTSAKEEKSAALDSEQPSQQSGMTPTGGLFGMMPASMLQRKPKILAEDEEDGQMSSQDSQLKGKDKKKKKNEHGGKKAVRPHKVKWKNQDPVFISKMEGVSNGVEKVTLYDEKKTYAVPKYILAFGNYALVESLPKILTETSVSSKAKVQEESSNRSEPLKIKVKLDAVARYEENELADKISPQDSEPPTPSVKTPSKVVLTSGETPVLQEPAQKPAVQNAMELPKTAAVSDSKELAESNKAKDYNVKLSATEVAAKYYAPRPRVATKNISFNKHYKSGKSKGKPTTKARTPPHLSDNDSMDSERRQLPTRRSRPTAQQLLEENRIDDSLSMDPMLLYGGPNTSPSSKRGRGRPPKHELDSIKAGLDAPTSNFARTNQHSLPLKKRHKIYLPNMDEGANLALAGLDDVPDMDEPAHLPQSIDPSLLVGTASKKRTALAAIEDSSLLTESDKAKRRRTAALVADRRSQVERGGAPKGKQKRKSQSPLKTPQPDLDFLKKPLFPTIMESDSGASNDSSDKPKSKDTHVPKKKHLKVGLFCTQPSGHGEVNLINQSELDSALSSYIPRLRLPFNRSDWMKETEFLLPYNLWVEHLEHKGSSKPQNKTTYKKISKSVYKSVKPYVPNFEPHPCNCKKPLEPSSKSCHEDCLNRMVYIECTGQTCPCGDQCANRRIQKQEMVPGLSTINTTDRGYGVKTTNLICAGEFILEYVGEVISIEQFRMRMKDEYARDHHHYCLNLDSKFVIDGYRMGNIGRFVNHSCEPNCEMQKWNVNGVYRIGLFAYRDIRPGEELSYDYNFKAFNMDAQQQCHCGSMNCRGVMGGKSQRLVQLADTGKIKKATKTTLQVLQRKKDPLLARQAAILLSSVEKKLIRYGHCFLIRNMYAVGRLPKHAPTPRKPVQHQPFKNLLPYKRTTIIPQQEFRDVSEAERSEEEVIRCVCGVLREEGSMLMCDKCEVWQHCDCMNVVDTGMESYLCEQCQGRTVSGEVAMNPAPIDGKPEFKYFLSLEVGNIHVAVGDAVYITPSDPALGTHAYRIERLWMDARGHKFVYGYFYYRPWKNPLRLDANRKFYANELIQTTFYDILPLSNVVDHCYVIDEQSYCQGRPKGYRGEEHIYVCEWMMDKTTAAVKKIQSRREQECVNKYHYAFNYFKKPVKPHQYPMATIKKSLEVPAKSDPKPQSAFVKMKKQTKPANADEVMKMLAMKHRLALADNNSVTKKSSSQLLGQIPVSKASTLVLQPVKTGTTLPAVTSTITTPKTVSVTKTIDLPHAKTVSVTVQMPTNTSVMVEGSSLQTPATGSKSKEISPAAAKKGKGRGGVKLSTDPAGTAKSKLKGASTGKVTKPTKQKDKLNGKGKSKENIMRSLTPDTLVPRRGRSSLSVGSVDDLPAADRPGSADSKKSTESLSDDKSRALTLSKEKSAKVMALTDRLSRNKQAEEKELAAKAAKGSVKTALLQLEKVDKIPKLSEPTSKVQITVSPQGSDNSAVNISGNIKSPAVHVKTPIVLKRSEPGKPTILSSLLTGKTQPVVSLLRSCDDVQTKKAQPVSSLSSDQSVDSQKRGILKNPVTMPLLRVEKISSDETTVKLSSLPESKQADTPASPTAELPAETTIADTPSSPVCEPVSVPLEKLPPPSKSKRIVDIAEVLKRGKLAAENKAKERIKPATVTSVNETPKSPLEIPQFVQPAIALLEPAEPTSAGPQSPTSNEPFLAPKIIPLSPTRGDDTEDNELKEPLSIPLSPGDSRSGPKIIPLDIPLSPSSESPTKTATSAISIPLSPDATPSSPTAEVTPSSPTAEFTPSSPAADISVSIASAVFTATEKPIPLSPSEKSTESLFPASLAIPLSSTKEQSASAANIPASILGDAYSDDDSDDEPMLSIALDDKAESAVNSAVASPEKSVNVPNNVDNSSVTNAEASISEETVADMEPVFGLLAPIKPLAYDSLLSRPSTNIFSTVTSLQKNTDNDEKITPIVKELKEPLVKNMFEDTQSSLASVTEEKKVKSNQSLLSRVDNYQDKSVGAKEENDLYAGILETTSTDETSQTESLNGNIANIQPASTDSKSTALEENQPSESEPSAFASCELRSKDLKVEEITLQAESANDSETDRTFEEAGVMKPSSELKAVSLITDSELDEIKINNKSSVEKMQTSFPSEDESTVLKEHADAGEKRPESENKSLDHSVQSEQIVSDYTRKEEKEQTHGDNFETECKQLNEPETVEKASLYEQAANEQVGESGMAEEILIEQPAQSNMLALLVPYEEEGSDDSASPELSEQSSGETALEPKPVTQDDKKDFTTHEEGSDGEVGEDSLVNESILSEDSLAQDTFTENTAEKCSPSTVSNDGVKPSKDDEMESETNLSLETAAEDTHGGDDVVAETSATDKPAIEFTEDQVEALIQKETLSGKPVAEFSKDSKTVTEESQEESTPVLLAVERSKADSSEEPTELMLESSAIVLSTTEFSGKVALNNVSAVSNDDIPVSMDEQREILSSEVLGEKKECADTSSTVDTSGSEEETILHVKSVCDKASAEPYAESSLDQPELDEVNRQQTSDKSGDSSDSERLTFELEKEELTCAQEFSQEDDNISNVDEKERKFLCDQETLLKDVDNTTIAKDDENNSNPPSDMDQLIKHNSQMLEKESPKEIVFGEVDMVVDEMHFKPTTDKRDVDEAETSEDASFESLEGAALLSEPCTRPEVKDSDDSGSGEEEPAADLCEEPVTDACEELATDVCEEPAADVCEEPATDVREEPATDLCEEPAADVCEEPAADTCEEPATDVCKEPATDVCEEPAIDVCEEPATDVREEPATDTCMEPAADVCEVPAADVCEVPAADVCEEPAADVCKESNEEPAKTSIDADKQVVTESELTAEENLPEKHSGDPADSAEALNDNVVFHEVTSADDQSYTIPEDTVVQKTRDFASKTAVLHVDQPEQSTSLDVTDGDDSAGDDDMTEIMQSKEVVEQIKSADKEHTGSQLSADSELVEQQNFVEESNDVYHRRVTELKLAGEECSSVTDMFVLPSTEDGKDNIKNPSENTGLITPVEEQHKVQSLISSITELRQTAVRRSTSAELEKVIIEMDPEPSLHSVFLGTIRPEEEDSVPEEQRSSDEQFSEIAACELSQEINSILDNKANHRCNSSTVGDSSLIEATNVPERCSTGTVITEESFVTEFMMENQMSLEKLTTSQKISAATHSKRGSAVETVMTVDTAEVEESTTASFEKDSVFDLASVEENTTAVEEPTTAVEESATAVEEHTAAVVESTTAAEESRTAAEESTTAIEEHTAAVEKSTAAVEECLTFGAAVVKESTSASITQYENSYAGGTGVTEERFAVDLAAAELCSDTDKPLPIKAVSSVIDDTEAESCAAIITEQSTISDKPIAEVNTEAKTAIVVKNNDTEDKHIEANYLIETNMSVTVTQCEALTGPAVDETVETTLRDTEGLAKESNDQAGQMTEQPKFYDKVQSINEEPPEMTAGEISQPCTRECTTDLQIPKEKESKELTHDTTSSLNEKCGSPVSATDKPDIVQQQDAEQKCEKATPGNINVEIKSLLVPYYSSDSESDSEQV